MIRNDRARAGIRVQFLDYVITVALLVLLVLASLQSSGAPTGVPVDDPALVQLSGIQSLTHRSQEASTTDW